jgi:hypothetical protein
VGEREEDGVGAEVTGATASKSKPPRKLAKRPARRVKVRAGRVTARAPTNT